MKTILIALGLRGKGWTLFSWKFYIFIEVPKTTTKEAKYPPQSNFAIIVQDPGLRPTCQCR